jgi:hypothetical protein
VCFNHHLLVLGLLLLFKTKGLQELNGFTGDMYQAASVWCTKHQTFKTKFSQVLMGDQHLNLHLLALA